jgi:hypothetical protein
LFKGNVAPISKGGRDEMVLGIKKEDKLLKGDDNTKYFQLIANGRHRTTWIFQLEEGNRIIKGDEEYITEYYKRIFGPA